ncbi:MAG: extracellular solute-binding protein [Clostridia bacterium]|nr:extracellular solute-binding protein [Clostridia bacterium]
MTTKQLLILLLSCLLIACLALSACGGDEEESSSAAESSLESAEGSSEEPSSEPESSEEESSKEFISNIELPSEPESSEEEPSVDESSEESDESLEEPSEDESLEESDESDESIEEPSQSESSEETSEESSVPDTDPYRDAEGNYTLDELQMPPFEFPNTLFTVCVYGNNLQKTYYSEEIAHGVYNTRIENYVKIRNGELESNLGVKVQAYRVDDVAETLRNDATAGTVEYDAAMPFLSSAIGLAQDQLLFNLKDFSDTIHLQAPWWEQEANDMLAFDGKLYFAVGDVTFSHKKASAAVLFNKTLADDLSIDFYTMVKDRKWTLDTMYETGKLLTADIDGEVGMGYLDTWGTISSYDLALYHYLASGKQLITTNSSGAPRVALGDATGLTNILKVLQTLQKTETVLVVDTLQEQVEDVWQTGREVFTAGRALFYVDTLASVPSLRKGERVDFGILPMPLHSANQQSYSTPVMGQFAYGICIPTNVPDARFSAYMIEALACYSKNSVIPEYEEGLLRSTNTADWDSRPMLEIIFSNMTYDLGAICNMGGVGTLIPDMYRENTTTVASRIYGVIPEIEAAIREYQTQYRT